MGPAADSATTCLCGGTVAPLVIGGHRAVELGGWIRARQRFGAAGASVRLGGPRKDVFSGLLDGYRHPPIPFTDLPLDGQISTLLPQALGSFENVRPHHQLHSSVQKLKRHGEELPAPLCRTASHVCDLTQSVHRLTGLIGGKLSCEHDEPVRHRVHLAGEIAFGEFHSQHLLLPFRAFPIVHVVCDRNLDFRYGDRRVFAEKIKHAGLARFTQPGLSLTQGHDAFGRLHQTAPMAQ